MFSGSNRWDSLFPEEWAGHAALYFWQNDEGTTALGIEEAEVGRFGSYGYVIYGAKQQQ